MTNYLIVTRHTNLIKVLQEHFPFLTDATICTHITDPSILKNKHVFGILPLHFASLCDTITTIDMDVPSDYRGKELSYDEIKEFYKGTNTYKVTKV